MTRIALVLVLALAGCGDDEAPPPPDGDDAGVEAEPAPANEARKFRSNNPSPESVKQEVERRQKRHYDRVDESLDL